MQQYRHFRNGQIYNLLSVGHCRSENEFYAIYVRDDQMSERPTFVGYARHHETDDVYRVELDREIVKIENPSLVQRERALQSGRFVRELESFFGLKDGVRRFERSYPEQVDRTPD